MIPTRSTVKFIVLIALFLMSFLYLPSFAEVDWPKKDLLRPELEQSSCDYCFSVSKPGDYEVTKGTLIELRFRFPVNPDCIPESLDSFHTQNGVIKKSQIGSRMRLPLTYGSGEAVAFFKAKHKGEGTIWLVIDDCLFEYNITVIKKRGT